MTELISQAEFARRQKWSRPAVTNLKRLGRLVMAKGKVDYVATLKLLADTADPAHPKSNGKKKTTFSDARTAKETARAGLVVLELKERRGQLIDAAQTERLLADMFTTIKKRIRAIGPKCAQEIFHLKTTKKSKRKLMAAIETILSGQHDDALKELSRWKPKKKN